MAFNAISQPGLKLQLCVMILKITLLKLMPHLPGASNVMLCLFQMRTSVSATHVAMTSGASTPQGVLIVWEVGFSHH